MPSIYPSFCEVCYQTFHLTPKCLILTQDAITQFATTYCSNIQKSFDGQQQERAKGPYTFRGNRFWNGGRKGSSSSDQNSRVSQTAENPLLHLPQKTGAEGFLDKHPQYNNSFDKPAACTTGSARCTTYQGNSSCGTTLSPNQDAFTQILTLPDYRNGGKWYKVTPKMPGLTSRTTRVLSTGKLHCTNGKVDD